MAWMDLYFPSTSVRYISQDVRWLTSHTLGIWKHNSECLSDTPNWTVMWLFPRDVTTQWQASLRLACQVGTSGWVRRLITDQSHCLGSSDDLTVHGATHLRTWEACLSWAGLWDGWVQRRGQRDLSNFPQRIQNQTLGFIKRMVVSG